MDRAGGKAAGGGGERIAYVDAARGLAILCVVLGHLYPGDGIVQYISSFHVPVFFILSGLLMAARDGWKTRRLTEFAAKKAKRLLYPYATISALNLALIFARRGQKAMLRQLTATLLGEGIDALWFFIGAVSGGNRVQNRDELQAPGAENRRVPVHGGRNGGVQLSGAGRGAAGRAGADP